jgi:diacylglycerol kinase (ATP)
LPEVTYWQVPALRVEAEKSVALEVDGEYCGKTPVDFRIVSKGLEVIVP